METLLTRRSPVKAKWLTAEYPPDAGSVVVEKEEESIQNRTRAGRDFQRGTQEEDCRLALPPLASEYAQDPYTDTQGGRAAQVREEGESARLTCHIWR